MTGTSVSTPTIVANATGDCAPNKAIATATASSKKFDAPIIPAGAAILCGSLSALLAKYAIKENQECLNNQRDGNQDDVQRIFQDNIALKRENNNERQEQPRNGGVVKLRQECLVEIFLTFSFDKLCPCTIPAARGTTTNNATDKKKGIPRNGNTAHTSKKLRLVQRQVGL